MLILERPYVSNLLLSWASETSHPVLRTPFSESLSQTMPLNLVDEKEASERIDEGERVYSNSENALEWILSSTSNEALRNAIMLFKDKDAMRQALRPLSPDLFFVTMGKDELSVVDASELPLPVVLKPSVGFCSMGVYPIESPEDWDAALQDIDRSEEVWRSRYPESVVSAREFIIEGFIHGPEYAIDMYYDAEGAPHILNLMHHVFASDDDTSDRIYNTSSAIIDEVYDKLLDWLVDVQRITGVKDFPVHVEVRIAKDGSVIPIEFNPLRFAGLGGTDLACFAWGIKTYADYLEDRHPDLRGIAARQPEAVFTMSLLNPDPAADLSRPFDYEELERRFTDVLDLHRFDADSVGSYGFLFLRTDDSTSDELDYLLHADLLEFQK